MHFGAGVGSVSRIGNAIVRRHDGRGILAWPTDRIFSTSLEIKIRYEAALLVIPEIQGGEAVVARQLCINELTRPNAVDRFDRGSAVAVRRDPGDRARPLADATQISQRAIVGNAEIRRARGRCTRDAAHDLGRRSDFERIGIERGCIECIAEHIY